MKKLLIGILVLGSISAYAKLTHFKVIHVSADVTITNFYEGDEGEIYGVTEECNSSKLNKEGQKKTKFYLSPYLAEQAKLILDEEIKFAQLVHDDNVYNWLEIETFNEQGRLRSVKYPVLIYQNKVLDIMKHLYAQIHHSGMEDVCSLANDRKYAE